MKNSYQTHLPVLYFCFMLILSRRETFYWWPKQICQAMSSCTEQINIYMLFHCEVMGNTSMCEVKIHVRVEGTAYFPRLTRMRQLQWGISQNGPFLNFQVKIISWFTWSRKLIDIKAVMSRSWMRVCERGAEMSRRGISFYRYFFWIPSLKNGQLSLMDTLLRVLCESVLVEDWGICLLTLCFNWLYLERSLQETLENVRNKNSFIVLATTSIFLFQ